MIGAGHLPLDQVRQELGIPVFPLQFAGVDDPQLHRSQGLPERREIDSIFALLPVHHALFLNVERYHGVLAELRFPRQLPQDRHQRRSVLGLYATNQFVDFQARHQGQGQFRSDAVEADQFAKKVALTLSDSFVVERHRGGLKGFIESQVDLLFANEAELLALYETADFDEACEQLLRHCELAAVTRSEKGSVVLTKGEMLHIPAEAVEKVVDTTGAGDQYAAGFCFGLSQGRSLEVCGRLGSLAAAEVIAHYGPRPQVSLKDLAVRAGL